MPKITTEETKWLEQIVKILRINGGHLASMSSSFSNLPTVIAFTVGDGGAATPANGSTIYANPYLDGKNYSVYLVGTGYLVESTDYQDITGGGFELLGGDTFNTNDTYRIFIVS